MFADNGYAAFDVLRPRFWNDARIRYFYQQNMLMYAKKDNSDVIKALCRLPNWHDEHVGVTDLVHPDLLEFVLRKQSSVGASWKLLRENLKDHVAHLLRSG